MRHRTDERGQSFWDLFPTLPGQVNVAITEKGQKRGFHLHKYKTDHWVIIQGQVQLILGEIDHDLGGSDLIFKEILMAPGDEYTIPPNVWHAMQTISEEPSILTYHETQKSGPTPYDDHYLVPETYQGWQ